MIFIPLHRARMGITRVELITTAVIVILIVGILLPWIYNRRGVSQRNFCESRQMLVAKAMFLKAVDSPPYPGYREIQVLLENGQPVETSWVFPVLPYLHGNGSDVAEKLKTEMVSELAKEEKLQEFRSGPYRPTFENYGQDGRKSGAGIPDYIAELVCPESDKRPTESISQPMSFVVNCGMPDQKTTQGPLDHLPNGIFFDRVAKSQLMTVDYLMEHDGLENTLMLTENLDAGQSFSFKEHEVGFVWIDSFDEGFAARDSDRLLGINERIKKRSDEENSMKFARPSSNHPGGVNVAFSDGSTMFMNEDIAYVAFVQFMTSSGFQVKVAGRQEFVKEPYRLIEDADQK